MSIRIKNIPTVTTPDNRDKIILDGPAGTRTITIENLIKFLKGRV